MRFAQAERPPDPELVDACGEQSSWPCRQVFEWTDGNELAARVADWALARPLKIVLILLVAWAVNRLIRRGVRRAVGRLKNPPTFGAIRRRAPAVLLPTEQVNLRGDQRAETVGAVLRSVSTIVVYAVALVMVVGELGVSLGPLIAGAGIAGIALGFGAQTLVRDFLSGIFMIAEDQYGVGDIIDVGDAVGTVEAVSLRTTRLRDVHGVVWHVPNGEIRRVGNKSQQWARSLLDVAVAYDTDLDRASAVIKEVADELWRDSHLSEEILEEPELWGVEQFGADGVAIRLVVKTRPARQWDVSRELRRRIKARFDAEGIEIPFPQRTVWLRQAPENGTSPVSAPQMTRTSDAKRRRKGTS